MKTSTSIHRIGGCHEHLLESFSRLGPLYFQARNRAGGLGRILSRFDPILIPDSEMAIDPDNGVALSLDEFVGAHYFGGASLEKPEQLDLEFSSFPAGISIVPVGPKPGGGCLNTLLAPHDSVSVSRQELDVWRENFGAEIPICECCQKAAARRGADPGGHPLFSVFRNAIARHSLLRIQLISDHVDFVLSMIPDRLDIEPNHLVLADDQVPGILHLNMRLVHAVQIGTRQMDGEIHSVASLYDSHGNLNFQFTTPGIESSQLWNSIFNQSYMGH